MYSLLRNSTHGSLETAYFVLDWKVRTSTIEEALNKAETLQSENVQRVNVDTPTSDDEKTWTCVKTAD